jgi:uncharacterized damage-inducible protein DinB
MNLATFLIEELKIEGANTIKTLGRVDFSKADWKPHDKSFGFKDLAVHIADLLNWPARIVANDTLDFATEDLSRPEINTAEDLKAYAQKNIEKTITAFENWAEADYETVWTLKHGDFIIMQMPKVMAIRYICQNHIIHHRAQLSVYLRLLDIPVPALYGPSADEK